MNFQQSACAPIGIFDSGIGGLTVAKAVHNLLPNESFIYFGDTAHLPYGDKSTAAIQAYSIKIADFFLQKGVKAILIACNSASAAAYPLLKEYVGSKAEVYNVIDPAVNYVREQFQATNIGLIGTRQTVSSEVYKRGIEANRTDLLLNSLATPLLVPMIEEGFFKNAISENVISQYLSAEGLQNISALILGCTHYPLIKNEISQWYSAHNMGVEVIDSSEVVAQNLKRGLANQGKLCSSIQTPTTEFYVSDYTESFAHSAALFFGKSIDLKLFKLWE